MSADRDAPSIDVRDLDRRAVLDSAAFVARVTPPDLARPTPCEGWTLRDLLLHMAAQHRGFADAAAGGGTDLETWQPRLDAADPVAEYQASVDVVIDAFAAPGVIDRRFRLAEFGAEATFPAEQAMGFHLVDYVVHAWDVARTLGQDYRPDDDVAEAALAVALAVPNGPERSRPGAAFRPGNDLGPEVPVIDRIVVYLGRAPDWSPGV
jgi:uncharacterized protein (TIGR03086 family)